MVKTFLKARWENLIMANYSIDVSKMEAKDAKVLYQKISSTIADMESNGVYFPDEVKKELEKIQKES